MTKTALVAVGGNSLIRAGEKGTIAEQLANTRRTAEAIVGLIRLGYKLVVTHGNGPQVGFILLRSELSRSKLHPVPLDSCGADTQGAIGYMIQLALHNEFQRRGIQREAAKNNNGLFSFVLAIVKSTAFQMRAVTSPSTDRKAN